MGGAASSLSSVLCNCACSAGVRAYADGSGMCFLFTAADVLSSLNVCHAEGIRIYMQLNARNCDSFEKNGNKKMTYTCVVY